MPKGRNPKNKSELGGSAIMQQWLFRPVTLRPCLSTGLPLSLLLFSCIRQTASNQIKRAGWLEQVHRGMVRLTREPLTLYVIKYNKKKIKPSLTELLAN
jgi:hypothetical protein